MALLSLLLFVSVPRALTSSSPALTQSAPAPCSAPEYRQFDFWLGDWETQEVGEKTKDAHVRVDRILDGCVIWERYDATTGHQGQSFSIYDATRKVWHQTWVTNKGQLLVIEGGLHNGEMVLNGEDLGPDGKPRLIHGVWKPVEGGVRETAARSTDGGKTWQPWFDLMFRPVTK